MFITGELAGKVLNCGPKFRTIENWIPAEQIGRSKEDTPKLRIKKKKVYQIHTHNHLCVSIYYDLLFITYHLPITYYLSVSISYHLSTYHLSIHLSEISPHASTISCIILL